MPHSSTPFGAIAAMTWAAWAAWVAGCVAVPEIAQPPSAEDLDGGAAPASGGNSPASEGAPTGGAGAAPGQSTAPAQPVALSKILINVGGLYIEDPNPVDVSTLLTLTIPGQASTFPIRGLAPTSWALDPPLSPNASLPLTLLNPPGQSCTWAEAPVGNDPTTVHVQVTCQVALRLSATAAANGLVGQTSFAGQDQGTSATLMQSPTGPVAAAAGGATFFVADRLNSRLLAFDTQDLSGPLPVNANRVVGQPPFSGARGSANFGDFDLPTGVAGDDNALLVADTDNHRVAFYWSRVPSSADSPYNTPVVYISRDAPNAGSDSGCDAGSLNAPRGVGLVGAGFAVADTGNRRVLIWPQRPTGAATPAPSVVLGQPSFFSCSPFGVAPNRALSSPAGLFWDGNYLFVADQGAHRVLVWRGLPTQNQQLPDLVLGQADLMGRSAGSDALSLNNPTSVVADSLHLFVADSGNHRVVAYDVTALASGMAASYCLGQNTLNNESSPNRGGPGPAPNAFNIPTGVALVGDHLAVTDTGNSRVLFFRSQ